MSKKIKNLEFNEHYQAVTHCVLNDIKNYEVKINSKKKFYIVKLKKNGKGIDNTRIAGSEV